MIDVLIYHPAKTAMQSARPQNKRKWKLEFLPTSPKKPNAVMGWAGSSDTKSQLFELYFDTVEQAVDYAVKNKLKYRVMQEQTRKMQPKSYSDNFSYTRRQPWTH